MSGEGLVRCPTSEVQGPSTGESTSTIYSGGECSACGFRYAAYRGHLEPCPRCAVRRIIAEIEHLMIGPVPFHSILSRVRALRDEVIRAYPDRASHAETQSR